MASGSITLPVVGGVASVNGQTGVVSLTTTDIPEGSNLYFTNARAAAAVQKVTGTRASPSLVTAVGGITATAKDFEVQFIAGSGAPIVITANPQISAGLLGQILTLIGTDNTNTVQISSGTGVILNGNYVMASSSVLSLVFDGTNWLETSRNDL